MLKHEDRVVAPKSIREAVIERHYPNISSGAKIVAHVAIDQHWSRLSSYSKAAFAERLGVEFDPTSDPDCGRETPIDDAALEEIFAALRILDDDF